MPQKFSLTGTLVVSSLVIKDLAYEAKAKAKTFFSRPRPRPRPRT